MSIDGVPINYGDTAMAAIMWRRGYRDRCSRRTAIVIDLMLAGF